MSCPECNKRASEEKKALLDCKGNCEKLNTKAQRLSLVVAVLGTVLGKETLDMALGLGVNAQSTCGKDRRHRCISGLLAACYRPTQFSKGS